MEASVEALIQEQQLTIQGMRRLLDNYKKMGKAKFTPVSAEGRRDNLRKAWDRCQYLNLQLELKASATEKAKMPYFTGGDFLAAEESFWEAHDFFSGVIEPSRTKPTSEKNDAGASTARQVKLPHIALPKFSGNYTDWPSFADLFDALVIQNHELADVQRLFYLKGALEGQALSLISGISSTAANFVTAWDTLERRYNNKRVIVGAYIAAFMTLPKLSGDSVNELARLRDTTNQSIAMLKNLGRPTTHWDDILVYVVTQKLDRALLREWEILLGASTAPPTYAALDTFLEARIRSLEALQLTPTSTVPSRDRGSTRAHTVSTSAPAPSSSAERCPMCKARHALYRCQAFLALRVAQRREIVSQRHCCFNCLRTGHAVNACPVAMSCPLCGQRHHSRLHLSIDGDNNGDASQTSSRIARDMANARDAPVTSHACLAHHLDTRSAVMLATAIVQVRSASGRTVTARALLDQGSEASFISEETVQTLRLQKHRVSTEITGAGDTRVGTSRARVEFTVAPLAGDSQVAIRVSALVLPRLSSYRGQEVDNAHRWAHLTGLTFADPLPQSPRSVDVLLGADYYGSVLLPGLRRGRPSEPIGQETIFGWVVSGPVGPPSSTVSAFHTRVQRPVSNAELLEQIKRFWEIEEGPNDAALSPDEQRCEDHFRQTVQRRKDGRYIVRLPTKTPPPFDLGESRPRAEALYRALTRRLDRDAALKEAYSKFLAEYEDLGHMTEVPHPQMQRSASSRVYLPHHPVTRIVNGVIEKLRVVFNASSPTSNGTTLNDYLLVGPKLQAEIFTILLRWRVPRFALKADIKKMYRQIQVHPQDAHLQNILWHRNAGEHPRTYVLTTVTYGTASAPYLAQRVLQQLAHDEGAQFPAAARIIRENFYVDDVLFGADDLRSTLAKRDELVALLTAGGFELGKWAASHAALIEEGDSISHAVLAAPSDQKALQPVLGVHWFSGEDAFSYVIAGQSNPVETKRSISSVAARLYDPLGWVTPVVVTAKILLQEMWVQHLDWDTPVPLEMHAAWRTYVEGLASLNRVRIPRWCGRPSAAPECRLHGFADASTRAYAAVVYCQTPRPDGSGYQVILLAAKARVAPIKTVSIPRLELCAAVLLAQLMHRVARDMPLPSAEMHGWSDSKVVLAWLRRHPSSWRVFVANRVAEIQTLTPNMAWRHVPSADNPADCASRGMLAPELVEHALWWHGPVWLSEPDSNWPKPVDIADGTPEEASAKIGTAFEPEIIALRKGEAVKVGSALHRLDPFVDDDGLIRVGGRLRNAPLPFDQRHPVILPPHHVSDMIVVNVHLQTLHGGPQLTCNVLRQQYWLLRARRTVRAVVHRCTTCIRYRTTAASQKMADLPRERVSPSRPFARTGVDYAGPIATRFGKGRGHRTSKAYIALFVCFATKAVHLELVSDYTAASFLAALQRFASRRGCPTELHSDNGTTFRGADRELRQAIRAAAASPVVTSFREQGEISWRFIPPGAPHFGGLWEAGVKSVKHHLRRVVHGRTLTYEEMHTLLCMIEACLNSRPICPLPVDSDDDAALTPNHFLTGAPLLGPSLRCPPDERESLLTRWQLVTRIRDHFWRQWSRDYLHFLQQRGKWTRERPDLRVQDVVVIREDNAPPAQWCLGRVTTVYPGPDNRVRVADVRTATGILTRPIVKLIPLVTDQPHPRPATSPQPPFAHDSEP